MRSGDSSLWPKPRVVRGHFTERAVVTADNDANKDVYGREIDAKQLLEQGDATVPEPARKFIDTVTKASS
jgi:lipid-binding SYLF domain-containing protein